MEIKFTLDEGAYPPIKAHENDAGFDLRAMFDSTGLLDVLGEEIFDTGVHVEIPKGCVGYVQGRSGLNFNNGLICPTGTVDCGYVGSIKVKLYNMRKDSGMQTPEIKAGDKIAQLVIHPIADTGMMLQVEVLEDTERGDGGFGSTGR